MQRRDWSAIGNRVYASGYLTCRIRSAYQLDDTQGISFQAARHRGFRGDRIDLMLDFYDESQRDVQLALGALAALQGHVDPRYAD